MQNISPSMEVSRCLKYEAYLFQVTEPDVASLIAQSVDNAPDQVPYLFQGDIILTPGQMKAVIQ